MSLIKKLYHNGSGKNQQTLLRRFGRSLEGSVNRNWILNKRMNLVVEEYDDRFKELWIFKHLFNGI